MPTTFMPIARLGEARNNPPSPKQTRTFSATMPTVVPARNGIADRNPVVWPMPIMVRLPAPGVPVMTMTKRTKAAYVSMFMAVSPGRTVGGPLKGFGH